MAAVCQCCCTKAVETEKDVEAAAAYKSHALEVQEKPKPKKLSSGFWSSANEMETNPEVAARVEALRKSMNTSNST